MNVKLVFNFLGRVLIFFSTIFILPILVAYIFNESFNPFIIAALFSLSLGLLMYSIKPENEILRYKESFAIVALTWLSVSLVGSIPYITIGVKFIDSFFEAMSGFTTTGASIFDKPELLPKSILFWRALTQWLGGDGNNSIISRCSTIYIKKRSGSFPSRVSWYWTGKNKAKI